jgi:hypothetical protein
MLGGVLSETLFPMLEDRFPNRGLVLKFHPHPSAIFPAVHPQVGDLVISDEGSEITVYVGNFTHVHYDVYVDGISEEERAKQISGQVIQFVEDIFAERMEFYGSHEGGGGCRVRGRKPHDISAKLSAGKRMYVWSGPIED